MKILNNSLYLIVFVIGFILQSCNTIPTRVEKDTYTITQRDTIYDHHIKNSPENRDRGVVFPSTKETIKEHTIKTKDSVVERFYPDFIRYGLFESISTIGGDSKYSYGFGMFGLFPPFEKLDEKYRGGSSVFTGTIWRIGILENRLRWFRDAKNWTIGIHAFEIINQDARFENSLMGFGTPYVRKRFFLREEIPYVTVTGAVGFGFYPSQYVNASVSLDLGSIGGLNLRAYLGYALGQNPSYSPQIASNEYSNGKSNSVNIPYAGLGISFLDFMNKPIETETEWKDHEHSAWDIGIAQFGLINSGEELSILSSDKESAKKAIIKGFTLSLLNTKLAIPVLNNKFYAGTSLMTMIALGETKIGMAMLPIKVGYWHTLLEDELILEPFFELGYYPSSIYNFGSRLNLKMTNRTNVSFVLGYVSGNTTSGIGTELTRSLGKFLDFSNYYLGFSVGLGDQIFLPADLRYNK